jgi:hypothetical protein
MSMEELLALPVVVELRVAARAVGIGRNKAYEYAAAGQFPGDPPLPVHRYGGEWRVTRADLFRHLGLDPALVASTREPDERDRVIPPDGISGEAARAGWTATVSDSGYIDVGPDALHLLTVD